MARLLRFLSAAKPPLRFELPWRNSPIAISDLGALSHLRDSVANKSHGQRASAKRQRRNRHCENQFIWSSPADHSHAMSGADVRPGTCRHR